IGAPQARTRSQVLLRVRAAAEPDVARARARVEVLLEEIVRALRVVVEPTEPGEVRAAHRPGDVGIEVGPALVGLALDRDRILDPLPDVAGHVVDRERRPALLEGPDRCGVPEAEL